MPKKTVTFTLFCLDAKKDIRDANVIDWTTEFKDSLSAMKFFNSIGASNPGYITAPKTVNTASVSACPTWAPTFKKLAAAFDIFARTGANTYVPVTEGGGTCIGRYVTTRDDTCSLYLYKKSLPDNLSSAIFGLRNAITVNSVSGADVVATFLTTQSKIRVYVPSSLGTGHQTTTCNIIRRIISKGYANTFEVVYDTSTVNVNAINLLLPELSLTIVVSGSKKEISTISPGTGSGGTYSNAALGNCPFLFISRGTTIADQVDFGISGGVDSTDLDPRAPTITNTKYFLMLQPFQWSAPNYFFGVTRVDLGNLPLLGFLGFLGITCYYVDYTLYLLWTSVSAYVARIRDPYGPAVTDIQAQCYASKSFNVLPVYGLTMDGTGPFLSNWGSVTQISALANIVLAVLRGQTTSPMNRGTVIMTLDAYQTTKTGDTTWTAAWIDNLKALLPKTYQDSLTFWPQSDSDAWNVNKITGLASNGILIVNLPKVLPMPIFNYFYLQSSIPPIFEGKGTMPIMLNAGVPYLQLSKQANGLDTIVTANPDAPVPNNKVFLFPSIPYLFNQETFATVQNKYANQCFKAGNAVVRNVPASSTTINKTTFNLADDGQFAAIKKYLEDNHYINSANQVLNKFKALPDAAAMEAQTTPLAKTNAEIFTAIQTALGQSFTGYNDAIADLTTFFSSGMSPISGLALYFAAMGTYFNDEENDKLMKGLGYAVAATLAATSSSSS